MRDLAMLGAMLVFLPLALSGSLTAYLIWCWTGLLSPNAYVYGFMRGVPFNLIFAIISIALIFLGHDSKRGRFVLPRTSILFILFAIQATISFVFAYDGLIRNAELYSNLIKALLFCFLMPYVITTRERIHAMVLTIALGLAFHGIVEGLKFVASGGGHIIQGLAKFGDNNHFAVVIIMVVPILIYIYRYSVQRSLRWIAVGGLMLTVIAVIATHSRGGFLSLALMSLWIAFSNSRKLLAVLMLVGGLIAMLALAPTSWSERMNTIKDAGEDTSFMTRIVAWKVSSEIALHRPLTGGGFHAVQAQYVWDQFRQSDGLLGFVETPYRAERAFAAHSVYFELLGDLGFPGLFLFLAILANSMLTCFQIKRMVKQCGGEHKWAADLANMLAASMLGYAVGAAALSLGYLEVMYIFAMLIQVIHLVVKQGQASTRPASTTTSFS